MTDTQPIQNGSQGGTDEAQANADPQDRDSLQQQARRETAKAEGEDRSFDDAPGDQTRMETENATRDDPQQDRAES